MEVSVSHVVIGTVISVACSALVYVLLRSWVERRVRVYYTTTNPRDKADAIAGDEYLYIWGG